MQHWELQDITELLHSGRTTSAATLGPMAEVVFESLQHAPRADIEAMATYLKALPEPASATAAAAGPPARPRELSEAAAAFLARGEDLYKDRCATCHGDAGEGRPPAAIALAGNRAVTMDSAVNVIRVVLYGGYPPGTAGNPHPFGMPPFAQDLSDRQVAEVVSFIRASWGNRASFVRSDVVFRQRTGPLW
jgi:mono/diheme cytochrome c family protein